MPGTRAELERSRAATPTPGARAAKLLSPINHIAVLAHRSHGALPPCTRPMVVVAVALSGGRGRAFYACLLLMACSRSALSACRGDCDTDGAVTAAELRLGIEIALERRPSSECASPAFAEPAVDVGTLIAAVVAALGECRPRPTATPTPSTASTPTPTPRPTEVIPLEWTPAFDAADLGWMMSGWGPGDGTLWVAGGTPARGRILHFAGGVWSEVDPGIEVPLLNWVHGTSSADVFAAGNGGTVLHFDGSGWTRQSTPVATPIWGLWAVAPDDVWAVGGDVAAEGPPLVLHYDGRDWTRAALPTLVRPRVAAFFKVWASGPEDVYAVGQNGAVVHYDGASFTELFVGVSQDLIGIWGTGADDVMMVGGRGTAEIVHFDGSEWRRASAFAFPGLNGVWMRRAGIAHAVGVGGVVLRIDASTLEASEESGVPTRLDLHSVFGDAGGRLVALGGNFTTPERGVALTRRMTDED